MLTPLNLPKGETFCIQYEILIHFSPPLEGLGEVKRRIKQLLYYVALITYLQLNQHYLHHSRF